MQELSMKYKGYIGHVTYDPQAKLFHGEVLGLRDVITFQGRTPEELEEAFKDSINDYISWCKERGEQPEKSYSGKLHIRIPSKLHAKISMAAQAKGLSLNEYIINKLSKK
jgi:predicted HicB family RNase H-like nuclease